MASTSKKNNQSILFQAERPHFFKVILDDTIREKKLGIPRKFVRHYGHHLSTHVMLKMPSGLKWKVEVVKTVGAIWLQNGWPEFVEHYSIFCGSFIFFEYDKKNGEFDVAIFDKTTTEMDYLISGRLPRFFKIVFEDSIPQQKLRIPGKFVRNYGHWMSNRVTLKVPTGAKWQVEIVRSEGQIWLQNGWREFADYYLVRYSSFLVFDYEKKNGDYDFNVTIFDRTATEIDYPLSFSNGDNERTNLHEPNIVDEVEDDVFIEILDHLSRSRKTKAKSPTSLPSRPNKKINVEGNSKQPKEQESSSKRLRKCSFSHHPEAETLRSADQSFQAEISSNNLKRGILYVPKQYCIKNIKQGTKETILRLKVDNRWWSVKLIIQFGGGVLSAGLLKFARENSLKVGDVCIFGSINNSDPTQLVNVSIIRDKKKDESQVPKVLKGTRTGIPVEISRKRKEKSPLSSSQANKKMKQVENFSKITGKGPYGKLPEKKHMVNSINTRKKKSKAIHRGNSSLQSEKRTFQITMSPSYIHPGKTNLHPQIPANFARKYMKRENGDALLKVLGGRTWTVKYYTTTRISGRTTTWVKRAGWKVFAQENHLEVGDVCKFELIDLNNPLLKVVICRRTTRANAGKEHVPKPSISYAERCSSSGSPVFKVAITSSHLKGSRVYLPDNFINNLEQRAARDTNLHVKDRLWPVKVSVDLDCGKGIIGEGWMEFARENDVKVGDVCFFELIDTQDDLLIKDIPKKFVRDYGHNLSNSVILKVPSGQKWKVGIAKANGQIWLEKRWQEFMEYYSIVIGSLVVFQYDETIFGFNVTIFDRTCTEIDYPYDIRHNNNNEATAEPQLHPKVESEVPVNICDKLPPSQKRTLSSPSSPYKKMKNVENFANITGSEGTNTESKKENRSLPEPKKIVNTRKKPYYSTLENKRKVIRRASSSTFQSRNPSFEIVMYPSHVPPNTHDLNIPVTFVREYMETKDGDSLLNVSDGRTWAVKYWSTLRTDGFLRTKLMRPGWKEFAHDNHLQVGDVCRFELIDPHKTLFRVFISRLGEAHTKPFLDYTSASNSPKPFFRVVIKSSHLEGSGVHVPGNFIKNLEQTTKDAKLLFYGKIWNVKLLVYPSCGKATLSAGWSEFVRQSCFKLGDICTFELIDTRDLLIKVSISQD